MGLQEHDLVLQSSPSAVWCPVCPEIWNFVQAMASEFSSRRAERVVSSMVPLQEDVQVWFFASYFLSLQTWRVGRSWVLSTYLSADFSDEEEDMIDNILSRLLRSSRRRSEIYNISWYIYIYIYIFRLVMSLQRYTLQRNTSLRRNTLQRKTSYLVVWHLQLCFSQFSENCREISADNKWVVQSHQAFICKMLLRSRSMMMIIVIIWQRNQSRLSNYDPTCVAISSTTKTEFHPECKLYLQVSRMRKTASPELS